MDLFTQANNQDGDNNNHSKPLAARMRPQTLDEFMGQEKIVGEGKLLRRAIQADRLQSVIFYGPPGTGKTTLAEIIANTTVAEFESLNAVTSGVKDLREVIERAKERRGMYSKATVLFIDEIHRFNKSQQDALLPAVEDGTVVLIGATTENPYFEVNSPLISRSRIFKLEKLNASQIIEVMERALENEEKGLGRYEVEISSDALEHLADVANGDARQALNALELAVLTTPTEGGVKTVDLEVAEESIQQKAINYDQSGDNHYDTISAFVKSLRGSDPDAALYWLAKMIEAGEDPMFIARRMIVHAAEDVGNANPHALMLAVSAAEALEYVGLPEARIPLAQAAIYIASVPKSNAVVNAIDEAMEAVKSNSTSGVPSHLKDAHYSGAEDLGNGQGYKYPHSYPGNYVKQQYLPDELTAAEFYSPTNNGHEKRLKKFLDSLD
ncbi:replication-associated recombination protein A [Halanaerobacter jeridensis]|uniref:Replication-associated recombination protein A n=1 Tax=Halanaerobacter jeridensis TaxID=706427 RepID=A0A939BMF3_9FIRM|nr:replication-associated recombination protein A [Halanaerobacter jeridensis]MBM7556295.1 putative ATPase [Halanaerobacter jeridensis]